MPRRHSPSQKSEIFDSPLSEGAEGASAPVRLTGKSQFIGLFVRRNQPKVTVSLRTVL